MDNLIEVKKKNGFYELRICGVALIKDRKKETLKNVILYLGRLYVKNQIKELEDKLSMIMARANKDDSHESENIFLPPPKKVSLNHGPCNHGGVLY